MKVEELTIDFFNLLFTSEKAVYHGDCLKEQSQNGPKHILIDCKKQALCVAFLDKLRYLVMTHKDSLVKIVIFNFNHQKFFEDRQFLFKFKHFTGVDRLRFLTVPENYRLFESYLSEMPATKCCGNCSMDTTDVTFFLNSL